MTTTITRRQAVVGAVALPGVPRDDLGAHAYMQPGCQQDWEGWIADKLGAADRKNQAAGGVK